MRKEDIKALSVEDLQARAVALKAELSKLRLVHAVSPLEQPRQLNTMRKEIAQIKTELRARELELN